MPDGPFVDIHWLIDRLADPRLRIVDARNVAFGHPATGPSGRELYAQGHLPGAVHLDYAHELADPATPYAARVSPADAFAAAVAAKGIGDDSLVVVYDAGTIPFAARIVWNLRYYGHQDAYILAGGIDEWTGAGKPLSTDPPTYPPAVFTPVVQDTMRATRAEVLAVAQGRSPVQLVETQRDSTYAQRDADIAGATRVSGSLLLEDASGGRIASPQTLAEIVDRSGLDRSKRTLLSCGSGVSAAGSYFALQAAGFVDVAVYDGSWLEWQHDGLPTVPKAT